MPHPSWNTGTGHVFCGPGLSRTDKEPKAQGDEVEETPKGDSEA